MAEAATSFQENRSSSLISTLLVVFMSVCPAYPPAAGAEPPATAPASAPTALTTAGTDRLELDVPGRDRPAECWIHRPAGYGPAQQPPLIVCLHGTDDTARQMIDFWSGLRMRIPAVIAAPQAMGRGWCSDDVVTIAAMFEWVSERVWYDHHRVLLAGFSAGGAMTFELLYHEEVPVTAAAALANYVPPRLGADEIRRRREIPVFYAVGMADINHELMRTGLDFLRSAGANVELYHPRIGHTLDPQVAQAALDWFYDQCDRQTSGAIDQAANAGAIAPAAQRMEQIISQPRWYSPEHVARASKVLSQLEEQGKKTWQEAEDLVRRGQSAQAVGLYRQLEETYGISRLGTLARRQREQLESDPAVRQQARQLAARRRESEAMAEYAQAQKLIADRRLNEAAQACRRIIERYGDTPAAGRAQNLLNLLDGRINP